MEPCERYLAEEGWTSCSALEEILFGYHNWLKDKGMIREERGCETCDLDPDMCKKQVGTCIGPKHPKWKPRTITVREDAPAPGPTVEQVKKAILFADFNCERVLKILYPSVLKDEH